MRLFHSKDKQLVQNLQDDKATKKMFKRQPKLDRKKTSAEIQHNKLTSYLFAYLFGVIFIVIAIVLWKYYMIPYWNHINDIYQKDIKNHTDVNAVWNQVTAFFQIHKSAGATADIVFIVFSILDVSILIVGALYWFLRCLGNMKTFGIKSAISWLILACFVWIPIINILALLVALKKLNYYVKVAIANQTQLSSNATISQIQNNPDILNKK